MADGDHRPRSDDPDGRLRVDACPATGRPRSSRPPPAPIPAAQVVACAGLWSDRLAEASGESGDPRIIPFRGGYLKLKPHARHLVAVDDLPGPGPDPPVPRRPPHQDDRRRHHARPDRPARPVPHGVLAARPSTATTSISTLTLARHLARWPASSGAPASPRWASPPAAPPSSEPAPPTSRPCRLADVEPGPAGIRAQAVARDGKLFDDFAFASGPGVLHVRNAPSPAATSSLAIARVIADRLEAA